MPHARYYLTRSIGNQRVDTARQTPVDVVVRIDGPHMNSLTALVHTVNVAGIGPQSSNAWTADERTVRQASFNVARGINEVHRGNGRRDCPHPAEGRRRERHDAQLSLRVGRIIALRYPSHTA